MYGVGTERQMCLLVDRGGTVRRNGEYKVEVQSMAVVPHVVELLRKLVGTINVSENVFIIETIYVLGMKRYQFPLTCLVVRYVSIHSLIQFLNCFKTGQLSRPAALGQGRSVLVVLHAVLQGHQQGAGRSDEGEI